MKADKERLAAKIERIKRNQALIKDDFTVETLDGNFKEIQALKYTLLEMIEACLDVASHIISAEGYTRPTTYADFFAALENNGIIDASLSNELQDMARFRNMLVHLYDKIDTSELADIVENDMEDITQYLKAIYAYMETSDDN